MKNTNKAWQELDSKMMYAEKSDTGNCIDFFGKNKEHIGKMLFKITEHEEREEFFKSITE